VIASSLGSGWEYAPEPFKYVCHFIVYWGLPSDIEVGYLDKYLVSNVCHSTWVHVPFSISALSDLRLVTSECIAGLFCDCWCFYHSSTPCAQEVEAMGVPFGMALLTTKIH